MLTIKKGRKLLNYDLEILHKYVRAHAYQTVVVVFQDSEAFDSNLIGSLIKLFRSVAQNESITTQLTNSICSSWSNRIPFVLLFGIATSVALFHERLSRSASRLLSGVQFDVENTNLVLERIFQKTVTSANVPVRLGHKLVSSLMARQKDHVQSIQSFTAALKVG